MPSVKGPVVVISAKSSLASLLLMLKSATRVVVKRMFNRVGLDVVARATVPDLIASQQRLISQLTQSMAQQSAAHPYLQPSPGQGSGDKRLNYEHLNQELKWRDQIIAELQFKLERSYKY